ncbi:uncharacterized protein FIESC28_04116 [Fusarium coffeatum]|uniref:Heterokaryon incompatibility domain-containing protein n=1 Tax=Fusarium coffeatum TaxID=231269 RepID=A0A366S1E3_9HYPO|nr:uncharacterized protein FIESC28_04116 [Fusarium coffeatum]RBR23121.1 hypothetical protein FIESC28_04116 [Fusarium coffeatum]
MPPTTRQTSRRLYQPLDRNGREIRLIEILPTYANQTIQCKLHTVTLTPGTYYVCISYVWGDPSITEEIVVNGVRKSVTVNLATALRHLKKHWVEIERESNPDADPSKFRLWADALSINQDDPLERGHQVGLMASIYSSADMVLAWLSSDDRDVTLGFNVLDRVLVASSVQPYMSDERRIGHIIWELSFLFLDFWGIRKEYGGQPQPDEPLIPLQQIWKLGFWSRVWIQQEIILARRVYYISPSHRMSHNQFLLANKWVHRFPSLYKAGTDWSKEAFTQWQRKVYKEFLPSQRGVMNLLKAKGLFGRISEGLSISDRMKLHFSADLQATDDLDYVYGLLAISKVPIEPDYTRSIREVYIELVQILESMVSSERSSTQDLYSLLTRHAVGIRQLHGLPTWAPVFSASDKRQDINLPPSGYWSQHYNSLLPVVTSEGSLWIKVIRVQTVDTVFREPGDPDFVYKGLSSFIHDFPRIYEKTRGGDKYINGESILQVLCRTFLLKSVCQYNVDRFFNALIASGQGRPEDFDRKLRSTYGSELNTIIHEWDSAAEHLLGSTFFTTKDGYIGLVREEVLPGDVVCNLAHDIPFIILRPEDGHYLFVDNCFVADLKRAELGTLCGSEGLNFEEVEIR